MLRSLKVLSQVDESFNIFDVEKAFWKKSIYHKGEKRMSIGVIFLVASILRRAVEGFDETKIHSFD